MVWLSKQLLNLSKWLDRRFPEKLTTAQVNMQISGFRKDIDLLNSVVDKLISKMDVIQTLENDISTLKSDLAALKTMSSVKSRVSSSSPSPFPVFPSKMSPVMPATPK